MPLLETNVMASAQEEWGEMACWEDAGEMLDVPLSMTHSEWKTAIVVIALFPLGVGCHFI